MQIVVVTSVLSESSRGAIFAGVTATDGQAHRFVAYGDPPVLARVPIEGETWAVTGVVKHHARYGPQVHVASAVLQRPSGRLLVSLLKGRSFRGIGALTAQALWSALGEALYSVLDSADISSLLTVLGDSKRAEQQAQTLVEVWKDIGAESETMIWLDRHGLGPRLSSQIIGCLGRDAVRHLEEDPYRLSAFATPWATMDKLARAMGLLANDRRRLAAAVEASLYARLDEHRDTWVADSELRRRLIAILGHELVDESLRVAAEDRVAIRYRGGWQALGPATMESYIADRVCNLSETASTGPRGDIDVDIAQWELSAGVRLTSGQRDAVRMAMTNSVSELLGGAGVGKTTVLKAITELSKRAGIDVAQMALSGRAALRITEATGEEARTIHGFLELAERDKLNLSENALVIVDEASMVDITLAYRLLRATETGARLLFVGDPGQLPPIGPGLVLHILAGAARIPRTELVEVMRQAAETGIPTFADALRNGQMPILPSFDPNLQSGVSMIECARKDVVAKVQTVSGLLEGEVQVIGAFKGDATPENGGTRAINAVFHDAAVEGKTLVLNRFAEGEPVMWRQNDYEIGLMNGELGIVMPAGEPIEREPPPEDAVMQIQFPGRTVAVAVDRLRDLELAYAITAHKAQGSAFDRVIIPVIPHRLLDRTLIYTALTRARRQVVFVGDRRALELAIREEPSASRRLTALGWRLEDEEPRLDAATS